MDLNKKQAHSLERAILAAREFDNVTSSTAIKLNTHSAFVTKITPT